MKNYYAIIQNESLNGAHPFVSEIRAEKAIDNKSVLNETLDEGEALIQIDLDEFNMISKYIGNGITTLFNSNLTPRLFI